MAITKASSSAVAPAAKGDLVVGSATNDAAVLGVGSTDQVLTVDSSTATGLKWATPAAGGMTLIQETVASANTGISFSSIPQTYKQLLLIWSGIRHSAAGATFHLRINANSANYFSNSQTQRNSETAQADGNSVGFIGSYSYGTNVPAFGVNVNDASNINNSSFGRVLIDNYTSTTKGKSFEHNFGFNSYETGQLYHVNGNGFWNSTDAVTSLDIVRTAGTATASNFTNTSIRLYGVS